MKVFHLRDARIMHAILQVQDPRQLALDLVAIVTAYGQPDHHDPVTLCARFCELFVTSTARSDGRCVVTVSRKDASGVEVDLYCAEVTADLFGSKVTIAYCEPGGWVPRIATAFIMAPTKAPSH